MDPVTVLGIAAGVVEMCCICTALINSFKILRKFRDNPLEEVVNRLGATMECALVILKELEKYERENTITYRDDSTGDWTPIGLNLNVLNDCIRECKVYLEELELKWKLWKLFKGSGIKKKLSTINDDLEKAYGTLSVALGTLNIGQFQQLHQGILY